MSEFRIIRKHHDGLIAEFTVDSHFEREKEIGRFVLIYCLVGNVEVQENKMIAHNDTGEFLTSIEW